MIKESESKDVVATPNVEATNKTVLYSKDGNYSSGHMDLSYRSIRGIVFTIIYMASIVAMVVEIIFIRRDSDDWLENYDYFHDVVAIVLTIIIFIIVAIVHRQLHNGTSRYGIVKSNAIMEVTKKTIVIGLTEVAEESNTKTQYSWENVINISQQEELKNHSRVGWSWFTGFKTVNKVDNDRSPISLHFDDGKFFVLNDRSKKTIDMLRTLSSRTNN